ncbi:MAG: N-6 DNA methylase [Acidobacteriota bacterium]
MSTPAHSFTAITSEGGLLPADFLTELLAPNAAIEGLAPVSYNLAEGERISEQVNRSWNRLKGRWADFKKAIAGKPEGAPTTTETRDRWLQPFFQELGFGQRLPLTQPIEVDGRSYSISHGWSHVPIHLVGSHLDVDSRTPGAVGAAKASPHSLVQQVLNASERHLWGIVSNGLIFRLIRDNIALTRLSYVEWDLKAIFDGDLYSEFFVLWLVAHQSRFEGERADQCWLEKWKQVAADKGLRALENLRPGVARAIEALGAGLVSHPANQALRAKLSRGELTTQEFYRQVLRVIYRMLFLFVAEDRGLLHSPLPKEDAPKEVLEKAQRTRTRYREFYAITRLRELTLHRAGTPHPDLWEVFQFVTQKLGSDTGCPELALPALGTFLWDAARSTPDLAEALVSNRYFLTAIHALGFVQEGSVRRAIDYKNLGSEELGSVYEGLLELHPLINADTGAFGLNTASGNERKTSGSYYTPDSLVQCLLDSALEPVMVEAVQGKQGQSAADALLKLKICDPAVGSGHFLIAAAHRLAKGVAAARSEEDEPSPKDTRTALRDVIGRCLYGVDLNPMAAELCRVSLWLEALEPGKPLSFLDHHIRVGNSLLGATPELVANGIPDDAFVAIEGDDKKACAVLRTRNKAERKGWGPLFAVEDARTQAALQQAAAALEDLPDDRPEDIRAKELAFRRHEETEEYRHKTRLADAWCAAFVIRKHFREPGREASASGITQGHLIDLAAARALVADLACEVERVAGHYKFFHWHLAFPEVFAKGGFDCVLGNPPWDTLSPDRREFFAKWVNGLRSMAPEEQEAEIDRLLGRIDIAAQWAQHCRDLFALVHFLKNSGVYTLYAPGNLGKGDFNIYRMFVETALRRIRPGGVASQVVPAGLYGGANASAIRKFVLDENRLVFLAGCENKGAVFFPGVHPQTWFSIYAIERGGSTSAFRAIFGVDSVEKATRALLDAMEFDAGLIRQLAPDTYAIPDLRNLAELTTSQKMYDRYPPFGRDITGLPSRHYQREIEMDCGLFTIDPDGLPVYEGRMIDHFDHRTKTYVSGHGNSALWIARAFGDPEKAIAPQWRIRRQDIPSKLGNRVNRYRIGFGDVANPRNERSFVATLIPPNVICGNTVPTIDFGWVDEWAYLPWLAIANSFVMDNLVRKKLTSQHLKPYILDSLPFPRPALTDPWVQRVAPLVLRLVCTAPEMVEFWNSMAQHEVCAAVPSGTVPLDAFTDEPARALARAELDAIVAHEVFGLTRDELNDVLESFPVLRNRDEKTYGVYRTKQLILDALERLG